MVAISYLIAYSFNIFMRMLHPIVPVRGPHDSVWVFYYGSDHAINLVSYSVCLHGRVPERYELWSLNASVVHEVHLFA